MTKKRKEVILFMNKGIAIYPGLDNSPEENLQLLEHAASCGFTRVFISLVLPYANLPIAKSELPTLLTTARKLDMEIIAALTPDVMRALHITHLSLNAFQFLGISALYLINFCPEDLAELSHNKNGLRILFNAAHLTNEELQLLLHEKPCLSQIEALHSGYAREGTGLSEENLIRRTVMLHQAGIRVAASLPSFYRPRSPFWAGLPSLEMHRHMDPDLAGRHLAAIGVDSIFIADSMPSKEELFSIGSISGREVQMKIHVLTKNLIEKHLLQYIFTARMDEARDAVRAMESGLIVEKIGETIPPSHTIERNIGDITIDNESCTGFMGELQIIKNPSPASTRTNVVARIHEREIFLIKYIMPGRRFHFLFD